MALRIALLVDTFPLLSESFVVTELQQLLDAGHDVRVLASRPAPRPLAHPIAGSDRIAGRVHYAEPAPPPPNQGRGSSPGRAPGPIRRLAGELRAGARWARNGAPRDFDILHAHFGPMGARAARLSRLGLLRGRLITTFHANDLTVYPRLHGRSVYRPLFRTGHLQIAISRHGARRLRELGADEEAIRVNHVGVDLDALPVQPRGGHSPLRLISVARLVPKKGLDVALEAVAIVRRRGQPIHYTIVGDGPLREDLTRRAAELDLAAAVRFTGPLPPDRVRAHLLQSDALLQPSVTAADGDEEGIPVSLMEAMGTGMPVVATRHAGIPELVDDGGSGFLVPERDGEALAGAILELAALDPDGRAAMGSAARRKVEDEFDLRKQVAELVALFEAVRPDRPVR